MKDINVPASSPITSHIDHSDESAGPSLPAPLAEAVGEFEAWMQRQLLADQARSTPQKSLYHYTGEASLRGILGNRKLWCFSHSQQSDDTEVRYSFDIARKVIVEEAARTNPAVKSILTGLDGLLTSNSMSKTFDFYFFSFSRHRDDAKQWEGYGDKRKGFAIGFAPALFQPDRTELAPQANENVFVGRVIYGRPATSARHRRCTRKLAEIITRVQRAYPHLVRGQNLQAWFDQMNKAFIAELLIWNCLTAKSEGFIDEQEARYIIMGVCAAFDDFRKQHNGRDYVETPLPLSVPGNITEILVGPDAPDGAEAMVTDLLSSLGYPAAIPVTRSSASDGHDHN
jgi:hypothetical protein